MYTSFLLHVQESRHHRTDEEGARDVWLAFRNQDENILIDSHKLEPYTVLIILEPYTVLILEPYTVLILEPLIC